MDSIAKKTIKVAKVDRRKAICNGFVKGYKEMLQSSDEVPIHRMPWVLDSNLKI